MRPAPSGPNKRAVGHSVGGKRGEVERLVSLLAKCRDDWEGGAQDPSARRSVAQRVIKVCEEVMAMAAQRCEPAVAEIANGLEAWAKPTEQQTRMHRESITLFCYV